MWKRQVIKTVCYDIHNLSPVRAVCKTHDAFRYDKMLKRNVSDFRQINQNCWLNGCLEFRVRTGSQHQQVVYAAITSSPMHLIGQGKPYDSVTALYRQSFTWNQDRNRQSTKVQCQQKHCQQNKNCNIAHLRSLSSQHVRMPRIHPWVQWHVSIQKTSRQEPRWPA